MYLNTNSFRLRSFNLFAARMLYTEKCLYFAEPFSPLQATTGLANVEMSHTHVNKGDGSREGSTHLQGHLRSIMVMVLSSTTSLVIPADCTLMDTRYLLWGTNIMMLSRDFSFSSFLENSTSWVSIFRHSMLYPSKSESGGIQEQAMAVEFWGRQCRFCILSGSK